MSTGEACVANIGRSQRRVRWLSGVAGAAAALTLLALLILGDAPRLWRLSVALPVWSGALGFLQSREKT